MQSMRRAPSTAHAGRTPQRCAVQIARAQQQQQPASPPRLQQIPTSYDAAIRQCQESVKAALADGKQLLEVEFPTNGLTSVSGDGDGQTEMNQSMAYLRQMLDGPFFRNQAAGIRVFFPDNKELQVAQYGQTMDPSAGRVAMNSIFGDNAFRLGYLVKQNALWAAVGFNLNMERFSPSQLVKDTDQLLLVAYPSFNPKEELAAAEQLYKETCTATPRPMIIFNGELDRIRGGYFPALLYPGIARLEKEFLPQMEAAYYLHNFKGSRPGALFRAYPGPWQVLRRNPLDLDETEVIWSSEQRPTLKQVALEILPSK